MAGSRGSAARWRSYVTPQGVEMQLRTARWEKLRAAITRKRSRCRRYTADDVQQAQVFAAFEDKG
jgi:hypothetical protein